VELDSIQLPRHRCPGSPRACANCCSSAPGPFVGGSILLFVFVRSCFDLGRADAGSTTYFGIGSPLVIGLGFLLVGAVLMVLWRAAGHPEFFRRRPEAAEPITRPVARVAAETA
jgi:hypothetical protein